MKLTSISEHAPAASARTGGRLHRLAAALLLPALVALTALLPRLLGLVDFLTTDEAYHWIRRTERFVDALANGRWADTILIGHPGVTVMWLGSLGLHLERLAVGLGWIAPPDRLGHLAWMRLGPVLANTLMITAGYLLLRRLIRPGVALVAALLWATSPFLVAQGRLLHLDALLTGFSMLAMLCTLHACFAARPLPWLLAVGVLTGLALLTKGPALIVLPVLGLTMFALAPGGFREGRSRPGLLRSFTWSVPRYLLVLAITALVAFALWPALWVVPARAIETYLGEIIYTGGRPNSDGQFFLGRDDKDPGPLFYPIAGLYRLTPLELLGLLLLPLFAWQTRRSTSHDPALRRERLVLLALSGYMLFWVLVMTAGPKKFDRYILPAWPALLTLSALGLTAGWAWLQARWRRMHTALPITLLLLFQGGSLALYHPYHLSYFNPLLGGGPVAQDMFLVGWGEGMDQVGAWLSARPDIGHGQIISALPPTLQPFVPVPVQLIQEIDSANPNYAVVYRESLQRSHEPAIYARIRQTAPLHVIRIHGIEYAWIHQLPRPFATPLDAEFGAALGLLGFTAVQEGATLVVTPAWDVRATPPADLLVFMHLYDEAGTRVAQVDVAPGGADLAPTSQWQPGEQVGVPLPMALPAELPPGTYTLTLGLYDPASGARLALSAGPRADPALACPEAALLGQVTLTR
jgi:4-amino-4-deoxy-L-arabinose transferase-like glycosyltransferase